MQIQDGLPWAGRVRPRSSRSSFFHLCQDVGKEGPARPSTTGNGAEQAPAQNMDKARIGRKIRRTALS